MRSRTDNAASVLQPEPSGSRAVDLLDREIVPHEQVQEDGRGGPSGGPSVVRPPATLRTRPESEAEVLEARPERPGGSVSCGRLSAAEPSREGTRSPW